MAGEEVKYFVKILNSSHDWFLHLFAVSLLKSSEIFFPMHQIAHGAEAILYQDDSRIIKERPEKHYRLPELDESLRKFRTKREAKVLLKLQEVQFPAPRLLETAEKSMTLIMEQIPGKKVRDVLLDKKTPANTISSLAT